jgi:undecaprenyl-diphosphatase
VACIAAAFFIWLAAMVAQGETAQFDSSIRHAVLDFASPGLTKLMEAVTFLGSGWVLIGIAVWVTLALFFAGRRDRALPMIIAMAGGELLLWTLKVHFHRPRPEPFFGEAIPETYSFPSGHALLSYCCYGTIAVMADAHRVLARVAAAVLILAIGFSRIYLGVHYPTDVIAGYLVATAWMGVVAVICRLLANIER